MVVFRKVIESKIKDPRGRLTRLIKCTFRDARDLIKHCIQRPSNEGFTQANYLLEKMYGNTHRILFSYRKEVKDWPQIKFGDSREFRKFHSFLLKGRSVAANQRWNSLKSSYILCMMTPCRPNREVEQTSAKNQKASQKRARYRRLHNVY